MMRWKRWWPDLSEDMPVDVMPASNGEFIPNPPTAQQRAIMALQNEEAERLRRKLGMSRRDFVRTAAAYAVGFWAIGQVAPGEFGRFAFAHNTGTTAACDLEWDDKTGRFVSLQNMPGEFIFDVQSHHVESDGMWRVTNPAFEAFFAAIWSQAGPVTGGKPGARSGSPTDPGDLTPGSSNFAVRGGGAGEIDPIENLSRFHYLKELFLDSATTMTVLSAVPAAPDITQPLPIDRAALTVQTVNQLSGSERTVMHAFVMPNRGSAGTVASAAGQEPVYMQREFEIMDERAVQYGHIIRGWKTYPAWGDVPYSTGWFFDDPLVGGKFIDKVWDVTQKHPNIPPNIATHKGFALPGFDQRAASPRDIGPAARKAWLSGQKVNFIVYHSGYDGDVQKPYAGDAAVNSADRTVDSLVKSLRENGWDATSFGADPANGKFANVPNVYAEIGSTWRSVMGGNGGVMGSTWDDSHSAYTAGSDQAAHLLGKLITYVGPKRICWGTDSLWFGSPQSEIIGLRSFEFTQKGKDFYHLPYGLDGDADDPTKNCMDWTSYTGPNANDPNWPTDSKPHPERSIRNAIFGRNAARVYRVDADAHLLDRKDNAINCDDVQKIRDGYILNQMTPKEEVPMASNAIIGPRNRRQLLAMRRESPWAP